MISTSLLRYPGGKARFSTFIYNAILASGEQPTVFAEPFCGGAATSIHLLESGKIQYIALNDRDPLISSLWKVVFGKSGKSKHDINWLIAAVESAKLSVEEWRNQKIIKPNNLREAAWKCLFLNRTSFNGIIYKAGPIGGYLQKNRTIDARFNREKLIKRIKELHLLRDNVLRVDSTNWKQFCSYFKNRNDTYLYLDPPYYHKAEHLYGYYFDARAHQILKDYLVNFRNPWMLSYDDANEVRTLYNFPGIEGRVIDQTYSAHKVGGASFIGRELFFSNRILPIEKKRKSDKPHAGMTVVGCFKEICNNKIGPIRIASTRLLAVGSL